MLPLPRFAELRAAIERSGDRDRVLAEAALSPRAWQRHQRYWLGRIAAEVGRGEHALSDAFLDAFLAAPERAAFAVEEQVERAEPAVDAPVAKHVPSYLVGRPAAPAHVAPAHVAPAHVAPAHVAPAHVAPAHVAPAHVAPAHVAPAASLPLTASARPGATAMSSPVTVRPALPFAGAVSAERSRAGSGASSQAAPVGSGTAFAPADAGRGPAMPFEAETGPHGIGLAGYVELVFALQSRPEEESAILGLAKLDEAAFSSVRAHFDKRFSASARLALEFARLMELETKRAAEPARPVPRRTPSGTAELPAARAAPAQHSFPDLTVEQYAWVAATLRRAPAEDVALALAKLRLTPASRAALEAHWRARMAADAELQRAFVAALGKHLAERA